MGFQFGTVELGEIALEIIGDLKTFDLPCAVFQRQNCEVRMAADIIKRKPKGSWIQIRFSCVFFLFLLVAVAAKQDGGIEIFQMRKQELRMQPEIPRISPGAPWQSRSAGKRDSRQVSGVTSSCGTKTGTSFPASSSFPIRTPSVGSCSKILDPDR